MKEQLSHQEAERESLPPPHRRLGMRALDAVMLAVSTVAARNKRQQSDKPPRHLRHIYDPDKRLAKELGFRTIDASPSDNRYSVADIMAMSDEEIAWLEKRNTETLHETV